MSKISAYGALTTPASDDVLPVVDVSDTTMASSGTTKKVAVSDLLAPALPLAGGTMSGAIAMGSHKVTGLTNGSGAQDAAAFGQVPIAETSSGNIKAIAASAALGSSGKWANSDHVHAWGQAAPASYAPSNPTGTTSTTQVMMGLGATCVLTPAGSGLVLVTICGTAKTTVAQQPVTIGARYGTGTAPSNAAAVTGTRFGPASDTVVSGSGAGAFTGFAVTAILTLTPATAYWFDLAIQTGNASDTASVAAVTMTLVELP